MFIRQQLPTQTFGPVTALNPPLLPHQLISVVAAALLITVRQGVWLRQQLNPSVAPSPTLQKMLDALSVDIAIVEEDRALEADLRLLLERIRARSWELYD